MLRSAERREDPVQAVIPSYELGLVVPGQS